MPRGIQAIMSSGYKCITMKNKKYYINNKKPITNKMAAILTKECDKEVGELLDD